MSENIQYQDKLLQPSGKYITTLTLKLEERGKSETDCSLCISLFKIMCIYKEYIPIWWWYRLLTLALEKTWPCSTPRVWATMWKVIEGREFFKDIISDFSKTIQLHSGNNAQNPCHKDINFQLLAARKECTPRNEQTTRIILHSLQMSRH